MERSTDPSEIVMDIKNRQELFKRAHYLLLEESDDEAIEWLAPIARIVWRFQANLIPERHERALQKAMHYRRQQRLRMAARIKEQAYAGNRGMWVARDEALPAPARPVLTCARAGLQPHPEPGRECG